MKRCKKNILENCEGIMVTKHVEVVKNTKIVYFYKVINIVTTKLS